MLRMPPFRYHHARSVEEAAARYVDLDDGQPAAGSRTGSRVMYLAGGTDLLPNIKQRLFQPAHVIGLGGLPPGRVVEAGDALLIDGNVTLHALARDPLVARLLPPLAQAAASVASPQIRRMGTIGGNILLDTRCLFYNQTAFWRRSLGYCLKSEGDWCHVIGGPKTCVAAQSSDTVPVLLALGASIELLSPGGRREVSLRELYRFNGMDHLKIDRGELLTRVRVPRPGPGFRGAYRKLRVRDSIDFPQLGVAITGRFAGDVPEALDIVVGAVNPQPRPVRKLDAFLGRPLDDAAIEAIAGLVRSQTRPNEAVHGDTAWRRAMASIFVRRALRDLLQDV